MTKLKKDDKLLLTAKQLFERFHNAQAGFRDRCRKNEMLWRGTHWDDVPQKNPAEPRPVTPVLFSTLESMLSDIMDNYPEVILLGEDTCYDQSAKKLTEVINSILRRRGFKKEFRNNARNSLKFGLAVEQVSWDSHLYGGVGDVTVKNINPRNFLWDPDCEDIQDGQACFTYSFMTVDKLKQIYGDKVPDEQLGKYIRPQLNDGKPHEKGQGERLNMIIEYWYKSVVNSKLCVHMARIVGDTVLYDSRDVYPNGLYDHGMYPFITQSIYPLEGQIAGLGICDIFGNLQKYCDKMDQIIINNSLMSSKVKMLINRGSDADVDSLVDWSKQVVEANRIDDGAIRWLQPAPLSPYVLTHQQMKSAAIKEESGQNMFNRGEGGKGVTAAAAILALQDAGSKRSRMIVSQVYDTYEAMIKLMLSIMAQFYTENRIFRAKDGSVVPVNTEDLLRGENEMTRPIEFLVSIRAQKSNPYSTAYQNELALNLLKLGAISPHDAIDMMSFEGKDGLISSVE